MGESEARREARVALPKRTGAYSSRAFGRRRGRGGAGAALRGAAAARAAGAGSAAPHTRCILICSRRTAA